jgi:hypothetical protein
MNYSSTNKTAWLFTPGYSVPLHEFKDGEWLIFNQLARSSEAYQYILLLSFSSLHASRPPLISPFLSLQFQPLLQNALKEAPPVALATVQVEGVVEVEAVEGLVTAGIRVVAGGVEEEDLIAIVTTIVNIRLPRQPQF